MIPAIHYSLHVGIGMVLGFMVCLGLWASSLEAWSSANNREGEIPGHRRVHSIALVVIMLCAIVLWALPAKAQHDSIPRTWMQQPYDGHLWHELPPPANVVNTGILLEHDSRMQRSAVWGIIAGTAAGTILYTQNRDAGLGVIGASIGVGIYFDLRGIESRRRAGALLQSGYQVTNRYEILPDSVAPGPHMRIVPIR